MDVNLSGLLVELLASVSPPLNCSLEGAKVAICSRTQKNVDRAVSALADSGYEVYGQAVNVANRNEIHGFADLVERELINVAARS